MSIECVRRGVIDLPCITTQNHPLADSLPLNGIVYLDNRLPLPFNHRHSLAACLLDSGKARSACGEDLEIRSRLRADDCAIEDVGVELGKVECKEG